MFAIGFSLALLCFAAIWLRMRKDFGGYDVEGPFNRLFGTLGFIGMLLMLASIIRVMWVHLP